MSTTPDERSESEKVSRTTGVTESCPVLLQADYNTVSKRSIGRYVCALSGDGHLSSVDGDDFAAQREISSAHGTRCSHH